MSSGWSLLLRGVLLVALILSVGLARCGSDDGRGGTADRADSVRAQVARVVDGDTIEVRLPDGGEDDVRYIGIDTPETVKPHTPVQCGGPEAHDFNQRLVGGWTVVLRFDAERRDTFGRLLAYVYLPAPRGHALFVNA